jgi:hypothetical protein
MEWRVRRNGTEVKPVRGRKALMRIKMRHQQQKRRVPKMERVFEFS